MNVSLSRYAPHILGLLRIITGAMFACHGAQKIFGAFGGMPAGMPVPAWIQWGGGSIEFFGGVLLMLGLFTKLVAFICSGTMAVAYFYGHARQGFFPKVNQGEIAVVYCWLFLYIAAAGPGKWALDNLIASRARR